MKPKLDGYVYFAQAKGFPGLPVKIGWSINPWSNIIEAHRWLWFDVVLLSLVEVPASSEFWGTNWYSLERVLHAALRRFRVRGEWFRADPVVMSFVEAANTRDCAGLARRAVAMMDDGFHREHVERLLKRCA